MRRLFLLLPVLISIACSNQGPDNSEIARWEKQAEDITIIRDIYGVPHIYGKSDADAVFGMLYAQCEDDFNRVEMNYINAMGRLAEVEGPSELYRDLRMKMFIDPEEMKKKYEESPEWLQKLMNAFADGINYYLHTHPETKPKVIERFEPWMALTFSEGSIGGDIERVNLRQLRDFYGEEDEVAVTVPNPETLLLDKEPRGSNGISIAPSNTKNGNALFLINPHTSFFFRSEQHVISEEGLNAYGAVTWGQFFIYQGFNERVGWMHTSSRADAIDEYLETVEEREDGMYYKHGEEWKKLQEFELELPYKDGDSLSTRDYTTYRSHHGPVIRQTDDKWVTISLMERPIDALTQSFLRTKAMNYDEFYETMDIRTNSSNNTVYADADGTIAYFHGNYIPRRNPEYDWNQPLDGSDPGTDYDGLHDVSELVLLKNPETGWLQNCNSTPFTAAADKSPNPENYETYMAPDRENFRGIHAVRVLKDKTDFTIESLRDAAYDSYLPAFEEFIPQWSEAYSQSSNSTLKSEISEAMDLLNNWDYRFDVESVPTSVAIFSATEMQRKGRELGRAPAGDEILEAIQKALQTLDTGFGSWETPWGEINRYQRLNGDIVQPFNDSEPSLPVGFASGRWGSLASYGARTYPDTHRMYGTSGNSFVAIVEFGERLKALSISTGGQSGDATSSHFDDQALMYTKGEFKEVRFYPEDVEMHSEAIYSPGEIK